MYVWTKKAEEAAKGWNTDDRKAGMQAIFGGRPIDGDQAKSWIRLGLIEWKDDKQENKI